MAKINKVCNKLCYVNFNKCAYLSDLLSVVSPSDSIEIYYNKGLIYD